MLLFIGSSRQEDSSLNAFAKYFFAHHHINYARHTPLYLADILSLQENEFKNSDYLKDNFSASKGEISIYINWLWSDNGAGEQELKSQ